MVPILAKESVIIKSANPTAILLGNYEIGYAAGLMVNLADQTFPESYHNMRELVDQVLELLKDYSPKDNREENILNMMKECKTPDLWDDQVQEMILMGLHETDYWKY